MPSVLTDGRGWLLRGRDMDIELVEKYSKEQRKMKSKLTIGLFGFGVVGEGLYHVLQKSRTVDATIKKVCIKNRNKPRRVAEDFYTTDANDIINDDSINLVVELIDNADEAYHIVKSSLLKGKSVVSGNKKMLAEHLPELIEIQRAHNVSLLYDASACGSIPVIRNLEEYYDNDLLKSITGILNGSSNFILTKIFLEGGDYDSALRQAQELGFAESNPAFDVEGYDSMYKLIIITLHAFGTLVSPDEIFNCGIPNLAPCDIQYAKEKGLKIKLVAQVKKISDTEFTLYVMPKLVSPDDYIYSVENEYNGVVIEGEYYEKQFMFGKGAGAFPTASSVLSDITARAHSYKYEYKKHNFFTPPTYTVDTEVKIYLRYRDSLTFSHFDFENITEKYSSKEYSYVIGTIKLSTLKKLKNMLPKLDVFIAAID